MTSEDVIAALTDVAAAARAADALRVQATALALELNWDEGVEIFRRVSAREITAGGFLTAFAEAVAKADLENQVLLAPTCFLLLAKFPHLLEQHRAKPTVTSFPPSE